MTVNDNMNQRREAKQQSNPFHGLQATVFQRKKPLPPIKPTAHKPSKISIPVSKTTNKFEKLPEINKQNKCETLHEREKNKYNKLPGASEQNKNYTGKRSQDKHGRLHETSLQSKYQKQEKYKLNTNTDSSQISRNDVTYTDTMATKKNIKTNAKTLESTMDCFESDGNPEFTGNALEGSDRETKRQRIFNGENTRREFMTTCPKPSSSSVPEFGNQRTRDISYRKEMEEKDYLDIEKNSDFRRNELKSESETYKLHASFPHQRHQHHDHQHHLSQYHHHHHLHRYQWKQPTIRQEQQRSRRVENTSRKGVIFEHSLLSKKTHCEEHTGIPCKPRLHKLHIS